MMNKFIKQHPKLIVVCVLIAIGTIVWLFANFAGNDMLRDFVCGITSSDAVGFVDKVCER